MYHMIAPVNAPEITAKRALINSRYEEYISQVSNEPRQCVATALSATNRIEVPFARFSAKTVEFKSFARTYQEEIVDSYLQKRNFPVKMGINQELRYPSMVDIGLLDKPLMKRVMQDVYLKHREEIRESTRTPLRTDLLSVIDQYVAVYKGDHPCDLGRMSYFHENLGLLPTLDHSRDPHTDQRVWAYVDARRERIAEKAIEHMQLHPELKLADKKVIEVAILNDYKETMGDTWAQKEYDRSSLYAFGTCVDQPGLVVRPTREERMGVKRMQSMEPDVRRARFMGFLDEASAQDTQVRDTLRGIQRMRLDAPIPCGVESLPETRPSRVERMETQDAALDYALRSRRTQVEPMQVESMERVFKRVVANDPPPPYEDTSTELLASAHGIVSAPVLEAAMAPPPAYDFI